MSRRRSWTDEQLVILVPRCRSYTEVVAGLGLSITAAGNWRTVQKYVAQLELDTTHFIDRRSAENLKAAHLKTTIPIEDILVEGSTYGTSNLSKRLVREGLKKYACERCGLTEWLGEKLSLELDHINGVNNDHRLENLKLLCPNCHSLTPTWRGRGRNKKH